MSSLKAYLPPLTADRFAVLRLDLDYYELLRLDCATIGLGYGKIKININLNIDTR